jgi:hypothetical protein
MSVEVIKSCVIRYLAFHASLPWTPLDIFPSTTMPCIRSPATVGATLSNPSSIPPAQRGYMVIIIQERQTAAFCTPDASTCMYGVVC